MGGFSGRTPMQPPSCPQHEKENKNKKKQTKPNKTRQKQNRTEQNSKLNPLPEDAGP